MSTRFPLWLLSTSTLSERKIAFTTTVLFNEGLTEIEQYGFITETPAFGPTEKWNSFFVWATSALVTITLIATSFTPAPAPRLLNIRRLSRTDALLPATTAWEIPPLWQRTFHCHLKKHGLLVIRVHQRPARVLVVRALVQKTLRLTDGFVHPPKVLCVFGFHRRSVGCNLLHQVVVIQVRIGCGRDCQRRLLGHGFGQRLAPHVDSHSQ